jgi:hypothetical protein
VIEVARQAGHSPTMALATYGHVIEEREGAERRAGEDVIRNARDRNYPGHTATQSAELMLTVPVLTERHTLRGAADTDWRVSIMNGRTDRSPGQYAEERHRRGLQRYRRRMRRPVLIVCVPAIVVTTTLALVLDRAPWWWFAGTVTGAMTTLALLALNGPPEHIAKWGRGAAGERRRCSALCEVGGGRSRMTFSAIARTSTTSLWVRQASPYSRRKCALER